MAFLVVVFLELVWGVARFNDLIRLAGSEIRARGRAHPLNETMDRYVLILAVSLGVAAIISTILILLPGWYVTDPVSGIMDPIDADTIMAPVHLLFWLVVVTLVARWMMISVLESEGGASLVERLQGRLVLPGTKRRGPEKDGGPGDSTFWEEESTAHDVVVEV